MVQQINYLKIDENTFQYIFEMYFDSICRFLNLYTKDKGVIEDIIQDVFCSLWVNKESVQVKEIKSYLYTSARNKMLNYIRNEKRHSEILIKYVFEESELKKAYECIDKELFLKS